MSNWQPIETAPDTGEFFVHGGEFEGEINGKEDIPGRTSHVYRLNGGAFIVCNTDAYSAWINHPTHWQPLPNPPEVSDE